MTTKNNSTNKSVNESINKSLIKTKKFQIKLTIYLGIIIRIFYVMFSKVVESRQYDLGTAAPLENKLTGHLGYIYYLNINHHFSDFDPRMVYQFFHPPLHHIIEAGWMSIINLFTNDQKIIVEWLQIPTCIYSCLILFAVYGIVKELKLGDTACLTIMSIIAFQPTLIFMAGSLNNDGLSFMFQFFSIYLTIKWVNQMNADEYRKSISTIVFLALSIALGMLTKLSTAMIAVPIAFVFLYVFIKKWIDSKKFPLPIFGQYMLFGIICVPLGLSWAVRCYIRFNMPLNYVNKLPVDSWQYVGDHSLMERFFIPNPLTLLSNLSHGSIGMGENMWVQMFRTAALGECDLGSFPLIAKLLLLMMIVVNFAVALIAFIYFIKTMILGKSTTKIIAVNRTFLIGTYLLLFAFFVNFCYNYPHECTMNFRYIVPTVLIPSIGLGIAMDDMKQSKLFRLINISILGYVMFSIITILIWSFY